MYNFLTFNLSFCTFIFSFCMFKEFVCDLGSLNVTVSSIYLIALQGDYLSTLMANGHCYLL
jgi:hypothetical protein